MTRGEVANQHVNVANRPFAVGVVDEEVERGVGAHEDVGEADYDVARGGDRRGDICCRGVCVHFALCRRKSPLEEPFYRALPRPNSEQMQEFRFSTRNANDVLQMHFSQFPCQLPRKLAISFYISASLPFIRE